MEAKRCLQCDLRLHMGGNPVPPQDWLAFNKKNINPLPATEGVFQLLDEEHGEMQGGGEDGLDDLF